MSIEGKCTDINKVDYCRNSKGVQIPSSILITKRLDRNRTVLKSLLRYWFEFGHLQPEQGIALLNFFMLDDEDLKKVVDWGKKDSNDIGIQNFGIPLLKHGKICSWLALESADECTQLDKVNCTLHEEWIYSLEHPRTIFAVSVLQHRHLLQLWKSDKDKHFKYSSHPLSYFVKWGRSKGIIPEWMPVAVDIELIQIETSANGGKQAEGVEQAATAVVIQKEIKQCGYVTHKRCDAILNWLKENNFDPQDLPKPRKNGLRTVKADCRDELCKNKELFSSRGLFEKAWQQLSFDKKMKGLK